jgi:hypothetical protein
MKRYVHLLLLAFILSAPEAQAAEEKMSKPAQPIEKSPIAQAAEDFTKDFDEASARHFTIVYSNYNMLKVVETVQDDVEMAVDKCTSANPAMKDQLSARHTAWKDKIKPVLNEAEQHINTMVLSQEYAKPKDIRDFFKKIDKERKAHDREVKKVPVTTQEACEYLLKTMDSTEQQLVELLQATLVSTPQAVQDALEAQAAEEEAKAKAEKEKAEKETTEPAPAEDKPSSQAPAEPKSD